MNRRSEKLDKYLHRRVEVTFTDGDSRIGVLGWNEHLEPLMLIPQQYYLKGSDGAYVSFRKSHVKSIRVNITCRKSRQVQKVRKYE